MKQYTNTQLLQMVENADNVLLLKMIKAELEQRSKIIQITMGEYQRLKNIEQEYKALCIHYENLYNEYEYLTHTEEEKEKTLERK